MRFKNLDLNLLAVFDALMRRRSVTRAGEELGLSQSAMSSALGRLRDYFQDPLLTPVGRRLEPTALALTIETPVRDSLQRIDSEILTPATFDPANSDRMISIVLSDYSLETLVPAFLRHAEQAAPGLRFDLRAQDSAPDRLLESGACDLVIAPDFACSPAHPFEVILEDPLCCLVDKRHPIAGTTISAAELEGYGHVMMRPPEGSESFPARVLRDASVTPDVHIWSFGFAAMGRLVEGTQRIAVLQRRLATRSARTAAVRVLDIAFPLPPLREALQWRRHRDRDPALAWVRDGLRTAAALEP